MATEIRIQRLFVFIAVFFFSASATATNSFVSIERNNTNDSSQAPHPQYSLLQNELNRYTQIEKSGGWKKITPHKKFYIKGEKGTAIKELKQRLRATGEYTAEDDTNLFNDELEEAVKKVQKRLGFKPNGVVDAVLIKELNIPVEHRISQILVNMERLLTTPAKATGTKLVANIPEFKLHVYEGSKHLFDMAIVVGTEGNKTEIFNDEMKQIVFSPYWNVPPSIVRNELLPAMRKNRHYLKQHGYEQIGSENGLPVIRQKPGRGNSLGQVKFVFPNSHAIYFHDTPAKSLFQARKRTFSHGCIRLAEPARLAEYLLKDKMEWTADAIEKAMNSGKEQAVSLSKPVAISITYITAWVDDQGLLHFREDVYGHDKEMIKRITKK